MTSADACEVDEGIGFDFKHIIEDSEHNDCVETTDIEFQLRLRFYKDLAKEKLKVPNQQTNLFMISLYIF